MEIYNKDELTQSLFIREQYVAVFSNYQNNKKGSNAQDQGSIYRSIDKPVNDVKCDYYSKKHQSLQC